MLTSPTAPPAAYVQRISSVDKTNKTGRTKSENLAKIGLFISEIIGLTGIESLKNEKKK